MLRPFFRSPLICWLLFLPSCLQLRPQRKRQQRKRQRQQQMVRLIYFDTVSYLNIGESFFAFNTDTSVVVTPFAYIVTTTITEAPTTKGSTTPGSTFDIFSSLFRCRYWTQLMPYLHTPSSKCCMYVCVSPSQPSPCFPETDITIITL